jgi:hypothetical protein
MEHHKTKDSLHVKKVLGHRNNPSTPIYRHQFNFESDEYTARVAKAFEEACELAKRALKSGKNSTERKCIGNANKLGTSLNY